MCSKVLLWEGSEHPAAAAESGKGGGGEMQLSVFGVNVAGIEEEEDEAAALLEGFSRYVELRVSKICKFILHASSRSERFRGRPLFMLIDRKGDTDDVRAGPFIEAEDGEEADCDAEMSLLSASISVPVLLPLPEIDKVMELVIGLLDEDSEPAGKEGFSTEFLVVVDEDVPLSSGARFERLDSHRKKDLSGRILGIKRAGRPDD